MLRMCTLTTLHEVSAVGPTVTTPCALKLYSVYLQLIIVCLRQLVELPSLVGAVMMAERCTRA